MEVYDEPRKKSKCSRFFSCVWKTISCIFTHFILITMVVSYCFLGAWMFEQLESENEKAVKMNISYIRGNVSEDLWDYTYEVDVLREYNWTKYAEERIRAFETELVMAVRKRGWDGSENTDVLQWNFYGALFYSIIVITTIGYGHIAPKTDYGKIATIFYAIVGIPLMLLCLSNIGDIMANSFRFLYWKVCCFACTRSNKRRNSRRSRSVRSNGGRQVSRSRTASLRGRPSQRSVDSAINLSEYPDDLPPHNALAGIQEEGPPQLIPNDMASSGPVLCNIYALDPEEALRAKQQRSATLPPRGAEDRGRGRWGRGGLLEAPPLGGKQRSTPDLREPARNPSPSIMSPMGFIVQRAASRPPPPPSDYSSDYEYDSSQPSQSKPVPIWLCVLLVVSYIVGGAFLFHEWEHWTLTDSAYFCFITLTTIGFGDFVPNQRISESTDRNGQIIIALCSLYLLFGIALLAMSFNLVQEEVINNVKTVARYLGIIKDDSDNMDDYDD